MPAYPKIQSPKKKPNLQPIRSIPSIKLYGEKKESSWVEYISKLNEFFESKNGQSLVWKENYMNFSVYLPLSYQSKCIQHNDDKKWFIIFSPEYKFYYMEEIWFGWVVDADGAELKENQNSNSRGMESVVRRVYETKRYLHKLTTWSFEFHDIMSWYFIIYFVFFIFCLKIYGYLSGNLKSVYSFWICGNANDVYGFMKQTECNWSVYHLYSLFGILGNMIKCDRFLP